jgi:S-formylglutathione hydrolase FrmB
VLEGSQRLADFAAQAFAERGVTPFVLVAVRGGDTYWHRRATGEDAMAMLLDEFLPLCRRELRLGGNAGTALMGWSMGGYGALRAAELRPHEFRGVCAVSAALWRSFDDGVGDAFDGAEDYAANDVVAGVEGLRGLPLRLDCGRQDPFYVANLAFVEALPEPPQGGFEPGGHSDGYWRRVAPGEMDFIGAVLSRESS